MNYKPTTLPVILALAFSTCQAQEWQRDIGQLDILSPNYPRAFFFRASEQAYNTRRFPTYESWESNFNRLQGVIGKCLQEECLGREPRNPEFFTRFKKDHPRQVVLLHFNGNARDPRYHTERYFPGHWIYRRATMIARDVPAESGESVIHVEDARDFRVGTGRYKTSNDDIALFGITDGGGHNWYHCEQVQLLEVDTRNDTIRVRRGCYGTKPLRFSAGRARAAAHQVEGPWGPNNHLMWFYNFATHCPRDSEGKTCSDRLIDDLSQWFGPSGKLAAFDGLEFDVLHHQTHGDTDGDGQVDDGIVDGRNQYGIGVVRFAQQLRRRMTDNLIIQADGALGPGGARSQRAWGILNGIESEGFPNLGDWEFDDWSGGLNRHFFWRENARPPVFNYVNHKWTRAVPGEPGARENPDVPFSRHRLALAACQFFDAMTCYSFAPPKDPDGRFGIWDELRCGVEGNVGWLGRPEAPVVRVACQSDDLLEGRGSGDRLAGMIKGNVRVAVAPDGVIVRPRDSDPEDLRFSLRDVPVDGPNLVVAVAMRGDPMDAYPEDVARLTSVGCSGGVIDLMSDNPLATGMHLRGAASEVAIDADSGASCVRGISEIGGTRLPAYSVHPPYRTEKGYTFWTQQAWVPPRSELRFSLGMGQLSPQRSDGVTFAVHVATVDGETVSDYRKLFEETTNQHRWQPKTVSLASLAGRHVRFKFVADCGSNDDATTDHARWGDVKITRAGVAEDQMTPAKRYVTWVNPRRFDSYFFFHHVKSPTVDLSFHVEGREPIVLSNVTTHAAPDVMYRVFERGVVLANPSRQPYTFDLAELSPGRRYRRIQATPGQDVDTNNGRPVGRKVTLGERDALFLVRVTEGA